MNHHRTAPASPRRDTRRAARRSGMALMIVIAAVALATVLGYAALANTAVQAQVGQNAVAMAQAECLAESGVNYAMYNLRYPSNAPAFTGTCWPGGSGLTIGGGTAGTFAVAVTDTLSNTYGVTSTATVTAPSGATVKRSVTASLKVITAFGVPNQAAGSNGALALGANTIVTGDLHASGAVTLAGSASVSGSVYAPSLAGSGARSGQLITSTAGGAPLSVTSYQAYTYNGTTYAATLLATDPVAGATLGPTATNPAGVYYTLNRTATLNGVTVNGTLLVVNGALTVKGTLPNTITPASGFPGLVADKLVTINGAGRQLTVNGLAWLGGGMAGTGTTTGGNVTINGSLLLPVTGTFATTYAGALTLNYNAANANVPTFSSQMQVPTKVRVVAWSQ